MNKRSQFQIVSHNGKIIMTDTAGNEYTLSATQADNLGRKLVGETKQLKRVRKLQRLVRRPLGGGG